MFRQYHNLNEDDSCQIIASGLSRQGSVNHSYRNLLSYPSYSSPNKSYYNTSSLLSNDDSECQILVSRNGNVHHPSMCCTPITTYEDIDCQIIASGFWIPSIMM